MQNSLFTGDKKVRAAIAAVTVLLVSCLVAGVASAQTGFPDIPRPSGDPQNFDGNFTFPGDMGDFNFSGVPDGGNMPPGMNDGNMTLPDYSGVPQDMNNFDAPTSGTQTDYTLVIIGVVIAVVLVVVIVVLAKRKKKTALSVDQTVSPPSTTEASAN